MLGILLISQFWTLANDVYDPRQARRIFGFIGGGASLGGAMGAGITTWTVATVGINGLLLVSAAGDRHLRARSCSPSSGASRIAARAASRSWRTSAASDSAKPSACSRRRGTCRSSRWSSASRRSADVSSTSSSTWPARRSRDSETDLTAFLAEVTFYLSLASFVVQVGLTSHIHRSLGLTFALLVLPVGLGSTALLILATGSFWAPGIARVLDSSLRYSLDKTTREVLFLPLPPDLKLRAKAFVDVTVDRIREGRRQRDRCSC